MFCAVFQLPCGRVLGVHRDDSVGQSNSGIDTVTTNVRLRWEHQPSSELHLYKPLTSRFKVLIVA